MNLFEQMDPLNFCVVRLAPTYENKQIRYATGFFYDVVLAGQPSLVLVTNWHVLAGRHIDPPYKPLDKNASLPNVVRTSLIFKKDSPAVDGKFDIHDVIRHG